MYGGARKDATNIWILNNQFKFRMLEKRKNKCVKNVPGHSRPLRPKHNSPSILEGVPVGRGSNTEYQYSL